jgi:hypothetical protein
MQELPVYKTCSLKNVLESLRLKVKLPMVLEMDNQGVVYLANKWSVRSRTRHIDIQLVFLLELKEAGVLVIKWISGSTKEADVFTKIWMACIPEVHQDLHGRN